MYIVIDLRRREQNPGRHTMLAAVSRVTQNTHKTPTANCLASRPEVANTRTSRPHENAPHSFRRTRQGRHCNALFRLHCRRSVGFLHSSRSFFFSPLTRAFVGSVRGSFFSGMTGSLRAVRRVSACLLYESRRVGLALCTRVIATHIAANGRILASSTNAAAATGIAMERVFGA